MLQQADIEICLQQAREILSHSFQYQYQQGIYYRSASVSTVLNLLNSRCTVAKQLSSLFRAVTAVLE